MVGTIKAPKKLTKEMTQFDLAMLAIKMVIDAKIRPEMSAAEWSKTIFYLHRKGWLYTKMKDGNIEILFAGYRIKEVNDKTVSELPKEEEGNIFYIPFYLPKEKSLPIGAAKRFFQNDPKVHKIVFEEEDGDALKEYVMHKKEIDHGQEKQEDQSATANV